MKVLVIDDLRLCKIDRFPYDITYCTEPYEAVELLKEDKNWDLIMFDHDLGYSCEGFLDIWPVIDYIEESIDEWSPSDVGTFVISSNPAGASRIAASLHALGFNPMILTESEKKNMFDYRSWEDLTGY